MSRPGYQRASSTNVGGQTFRSLEGKLAIVTGASRGIGAAIARNLASKGASIVLNYTSDKSTEAIEALSQELQQEHGVNSIVVQADMGEIGGPALVVETARNHFAHPKTRKFQIDIIINNAGISINVPIEESTPEIFHQTYNINVLGPLLLIQSALPYLPHDRSGRIVNVSSVSASTGPKTQSIYAGSKAALEAMTRTWARELSERATVNAVNPGPVDTDMFDSVTDEFRTALSFSTVMTPLAKVREGVDPPEMLEKAKVLKGRLAYPEEIAGVVAMLCSEDAGWSTGSVVCANGGLRFSS